MHTPIFENFSYAPSKAGLNHLSRMLAAHLAARHVTVNVIAPGPFLTDIAKAWTEEARQTADNALGRPGRPEEIVSAALYLLSPASTFSTGSVITVDGGI